MAELDRTAFRGLMLPDDHKPSATTRKLLADAARGGVPRNRHERRKLQAIIGKAKRAITIEDAPQPPEEAEAPDA